MPASLGRQRRTFAGVSTRCLTVDGDGTPFLLLHGYSDSADTWRILLATLARRGRRALAIDLPSHGRADTVSPDRPALDQLVDCALAAAEHLGPDTVVVGNSLGGTVALLMAERQVPLGGVVALGPGAFDHPLWLRISLHPRILAALDRVPALLQLPSYLAAGVIARMSPRAIPRYLSHVRTMANQRRLRALAISLAVEAVSPYDHSRISCPLTLVWGSRDRFALPSGARTLLEAVPGLRYERLEGVGHSPHQEVPERIADLLAEIAPAYPEA